MDEFSDIWIEQCDAAREIRDGWGTRKALGYLVGEKLLNYIRAVRLGSVLGGEGADVRSGDPADLHSRRTARDTSRQPRVSDRQPRRYRRSNIRRCATPARSATTRSAEQPTPSCFERARVLLLGGGASGDVAVKGRRPSGRPRSKAGTSRAKLDCLDVLTGDEASAVLRAPSVVAPGARSGCQASGQRAACDSVVHRYRQECVRGITGAGPGRLGCRTACRSGTSSLQKRLGRRSNRRSRRTSTIWNGE